MLNSEFENKVQQQMEELNIHPAADLWDKIEARLEPEKKPRRWLFFLLLFVLVIGVSLLVWDFSRPAQSRIAKAPGVERSVQKPAVINLPQNVADSAPVEALPGIGKDRGSANEKAGAGKELKDQSFSKVIKPVVPQHKDENMAEKNLRRSKVFKSKGVARTNMISPEARPLPANEKQKHPIENAVVFALTPAKKLPAAANDSLSLFNNSPFTTNDSALTIIHLPFPTSHPPLTTPHSSLTVDHSQFSPIADSPIIKSRETESLKKASSKWQYGATIGFGLSNVVNGVFSNKPVLADANYNSAGGGAGSGAGSLPNDPSASAAFTVGLHIERNIGSRIKLATGVQYVYQSSVIKTGRRVDSAATYNFSSSKIHAGSYYLPGNSMLYKNKMHFIQLPILFQYKLSDKFPVYLEAGPTVSYLLRSNALFYNRAASAYLSSMDAFNRVSLSFTAGAGFKVNAKKRLPLSAGYRFNFGVSSITKEPFGNQQAQSSMLYLTVPVKK